MTGCAVSPSDITMLGVCAGDCEGAVACGAIYRVCSRLVRVSVLLNPASTPCTYIFRPMTTVGFLAGIIGSLFLSSKSIVGGGWAISAGYYLTRKFVARTICAKGFGWCVVWAVASSISVSHIVVCPIKRKVGSTPNLVVCSSSKSIIA